MKINNFKNKIFVFLIKSCFIFGVFLNFTNITYAIETYTPLEIVNIGEFIYNDDYTPTADDCTIDIYSPSLVSLVSTTMIDESPAAPVTGWHYYTYTIPATEGKYPTYITCGSVPTGDFFKQDKSFIVKAPAVTNTSIANAVDANTSASVSSAITNINSNTNTQTGSLATTLSSLPATIWGYTSRTLTSFGSLVADVATSVWSSPTRDLTTFGTLVTDVWANTTRTVTGGTTSSSNMLAASDVWSYGTRNLTDGTLTTGSLALVSNLSSIATATNVTDATTMLSSWDVSMSDFGTVSAGSTYRATVTTTYNGTLTDSLNLPTITVYDANRNIVVSSVSMTRNSLGTYGYSYLTDVNAAGGVWESVISATVDTGKTLPGNDYWNVTTSPSQVIVNEMTDLTIPSVGANVTITNEGLSGYEYQYEWCVVTNESQLCGDPENIFHAIAAKYINPGEDFNTILTADVLSLGSYYFKVKVYFGTESSNAVRSFTATSATTPSGGSSGSSGSSVKNIIIPPAINKNNRRGDFNDDMKINSIDFSILLYFWKTILPLKNQYVDMNKDGKVDSIDFSIFLYEWGK